jgi:calcineurin-like phosphoesterase family protein
MGIPRSHIKGALESWVGNPGLCCDPDRHPYLVLAEITSLGPNAQEDIMRAVARSADESGPIQVSVSPIQGIKLPRDHSSYEISPSPGLRSFVLLLSRNCPLIIRPGSFSEKISHGMPAPITIVSHLPAGDGFSPSCRQVHEKPRSYSGKVEDENSAMVRYLRERDAEPVLIEILRIVLRRDGKPVAEYDLWQRRWLSAKKSRLRKNARLSLRKFRIGKGYQLTRAQYSEDPRIYIISDLHLGHANSIPRYKRPFLLSNPEEMDRVLVRNWNWTVKENDTVIFLGDMAYMGQKSTESYIEQLSGSIFYLEGNHDPYYPFMSHCLLMRYREVPYLFIHDPKELTKPFDGWVIHGHVHNKDLTQYPFFNPFTRMVNVSAELIGYRPISLDEIHELVCGTDEVVTFRDISRPCEKSGAIRADRNLRLRSRGHYEEDKT